MNRIVVEQHYQTASGAGCKRVAFAIRNNKEIDKAIDIVSDMVRKKTTYTNMGPGDVSDFNPEYSREEMIDFAVKAAKRMMDLALTTGDPVDDNILSDYIDRMRDKADKVCRVF